jgi:hypothetical protein
MIPKKRKWKFSDVEYVEHCSEVGTPAPSDGTLIRTTFDSPITVTNDDELDSYWEDGQMVMKINGVVIPSKTEVVE